MHGWTRPTGSRRPGWEWLASVGYSGRTDPIALHPHLVAAPRGPVGAEAAAHATITETFEVPEAEIDTQLAAHADQHIFTLPAPAASRATRLLAEIADSRQVTTPRNR